MSRSPRSVLARDLVPPLVFGVGFLLIWETAVKVFDFQPYFLPAPSAIWTAFRENTALIWEATKVSGLNALVGLRGRDRARRLDELRCWRGSAC